MDSISKKPNKIREIVRLQQILKKWRKLANSKPSSSSSNNKKSIHLILKRTLSFSDKSNGHDTPKGYVAVSVGDEQTRFVIPTDYLSRRSFQALLNEAEEEFGFEQTGILRFPCHVSVFERVLRSMEVAESSRSSSSSSKDLLLMHEHSCFCSSESGELGFSRLVDHHSPMCR